MNTLQTSGVTKRFGSFTAVAEVDLTVGEGEVVGLLGANGAGKTTLMRLILGLVVPSGGQVRLFGSPPSHATRLRIGYVPQGLGLYRDLTVAENLRFAAGAYGVEPAAVVGASPDALVGDLPLGLQRRVAFTAALQHHPDLLVLDEPTSGVAPLARARLWERIRGAAAAGAAVLVSTHAMDEARQADRLILMHLGRVVAAGSERDVVGGATSVRVTTDRWADAFAALDAAGIPVTLAGRDLRIPGGEPGRIGAVLATAGVPAHAESVGATLEEAMVLAGAAS